VESCWPKLDFLSPSWPSLENILPELKAVLPNADFVMGQMMFTKYLVVVDDDVDMHNTAKFSSASAPTPIRNATGG